MPQKLTVTIGIPAFNEQANIGNLLADILRQGTEKFNLQKILIASDGSYDKTVKVVRNFQSNEAPLADTSGIFSARFVGAKSAEAETASHSSTSLHSRFFAKADKKISLIVGKSRRGPAYRQNQIINNTNSDILVLLNADIRIKDRHFIERLVSPIAKGKASLTSPVLLELSPKSFFENVLVVSMKIKRNIFESWKKGNNGYLCHGAARALAHDYYKNLHFVESGGEDMYSYLECIRQKRKFKYVKNTVAFYRSPSTFSDHTKQSTRFFKYQRKFDEIFDDKLIKLELNVPVWIYLLGIINSFGVIARYPLHALCYLGVVVLIKLRSYLNTGTKDLWQASSTKMI